MSRCGYFSAEDVVAQAHLREAVATARHEVLARDENREDKTTTYVEHTTRF